MKAESFWSEDDYKPDNQIVVSRTARAIRMLMSMYLNYWNGFWV